MRTAKEKGAVAYLNNHRAIITNRPSLAVQLIGSILQCAVGTVTSKERQLNTESVRAETVGILLQKYDLEVWKPQLWTDEAGKRVSALSLNYDKIATIRHNLVKHHWAVIFTTSYKNLLQAAQERNTPVPDYYAKSF
ncbi:MAG: hypothetical protein FJ244_08805 [Nitrospira sp.]|nr:hypothetical protein [Nitrospira sp.]